MSNKNLLILERSTESLELKNKDGIYVLEGIFGELDKKNKNNRIYTAEEYLPQIESLQDKIKASKLLGELDHPTNFDVSLKNVSHIIEEITYDKEAKQIKGRIRLLDTDAGRQAKALVDAGVPLQISSRAAGAVESNGKVKIKQLFTYDLVADPGFENAELKRVNESYGFSNDSDILIYEIGGQAELLNNETITIENKETQTMAESKFITAEDFNKYSQYLSEEIKTIKASLTESKENGNEEALTNLKEYTTYLAEKLDGSISYSENIAEKVDQNIQYSEHIAEKVEQSIDYSEHMATGVNQIKEYTNYLAEAYNEGAATHEGLLEYVEYLKENLEKVTEYAEYVAETVNTNLITEETEEEEVPVIESCEECGEETCTCETEEVTEDAAKEIENAETKLGEPEDVAKDLELEGEGEAEGEEITEEAEAGKEVKEIEAESDAKDVTEPTVDADGSETAHNAEVKDLEKDLELEGEGEAEGEEITEDRAEEIEDELNKLAEPKTALESYKNEITEKLQALITKASEKKTDNPNFFNFVSESTKTEFNTLETEDKTKVLSAVEGRGYLTEGQILGLWRNSLIVDTASATTPNVISMMPTEYQDTYAKLSEAKKNSILAQSKMHKLETAYQVANFWQTRDLRNTAVVMEKVTMVKESKEVAKPTIGYDTTDIALQLANKFKK